MNIRRFASTLSAAAALCLSSAMLPAATAAEYLDKGYAVAYHDGEEAMCDACAQVFADLNEYRAIEGLPPLEYDYELAVDAQAWADYMGETGDYKHSPRTGWAGETLWKGKGWGDDFKYRPVISWKASPRHNAHVVSEQHTSVGLGAYDDGTTAYVVAQYR